MNPSVALVGPPAVGLALLIAASQSAVSQDRSVLVRHCLSITDVNERVECLETGSPPAADAASNTARQPRVTPSFDCRTARSSIERAICADVTLSEWDSRMGQIFQQASRKGNNQSLLEGQRLWLAERDTRCGSLADTAIWSCLLEMTKSRTTALAKTVAANAETSLPMPATSAAQQRPAPTLVDTPGGSTSPRSLPPSQPDRPISTTDREAPSPIGALFAVLGIIILAIVFSVFRRVRRQQRLAAEQQLIEDRRRAEWERLVERYGEEIAARVLARKVWQGMTEEQLIESWGSPADIGREIIRAKTKETWKYNQVGRNRFANRVYLENGIVIGWKA